MAKISLADGSGKVELTYLVEDVDRHGNVRLYVKRRGRRKIRMRSPPGSQAFLDEYRGTIAGNSTPKSPSVVAVEAARSSLRWLVERYYESADYKTLGERTRHVRRQILDALCLEPVSAETPIAIGSLPLRDDADEQGTCAAGSQGGDAGSGKRKAQGTSAGLPNGGQQ
jgi:hypothetical protein